jgi:hypothetical protein
MTEFAQLNRHKLIGVNESVRRQMVRTSKNCFGKFHLACLSAIHLRIKMIVQGRQEVFDLTRRIKSLENLLKVGNEITSSSNRW